MRPGRHAPPALVTGDAAGMVSLFEPSGEMLAEFPSGEIPELKGISAVAGPVCTCIAGRQHEAILPACQ